jgi:hypothetical protein
MYGADRQQLTELATAGDFVGSAILRPESKHLGYHENLARLFRCLENAISTIQ